MGYISGTLGKGSGKAQSEHGKDAQRVAVGHRATDTQRGTAAQRGYGSKWRTARLEFLQKHPLCKDHQDRGHVVASTVVDHIIPHKQDLKLFWDRKNWQALCKPCHDSHKQRIEAGTDTQACNTAGLPTSPTHPWNTR